MQKKLMSYFIVVIVPKHSLCQPLFMFSRKCILCTCSSIFIGIYVVVLVQKIKEKKKEKKEIKKIKKKSPSPEPTSPNLKMLGPLCNQAVNSRQT